MRSNAASRMHRRRMPGLAPRTCGPQELSEPARQHGADVSKGLEPLFLSPVYGSGVGQAPVNSARSTRKEGQLSLALSQTVIT